MKSNCDQLIILDWTQSWKRRFGGVAEIQNVHNNDNIAPPILFQFLRNILMDLS